MEITVPKRQSKSNSLNKTQQKQLPMIGIACAMLQMTNLQQSLPRAKPLAAWLPGAADTVGWSADDSRRQVHFAGCAGNQ
jgi:hypothetical protein